MAELVEFPDIEALLIDELGELLDPIPVRLTIPIKRSAAFLIVQRIGGPRQDVVTDRPLILFEAWAETPGAAKRLLARARAHVGALPGAVLGDTAIYRVTESAGPAFLPDPTSAQARYTYSAEIGVRGAAPAPSST